MDTVLMMVMANILIWCDMIIGSFTGQEWLLVQFKARSFG